MEDEIRLHVVNDTNQISTENRSWVVEFKDKFSKMERTPLMKRLKKRGHAFCLLPETIRKNLKHCDYEPCILSLGPYHHDHRSCEQTKQIKEIVVLRSLMEYNKTIDDYIQCLDQGVQSLKDAYDQLDPKWEKDDDAFLQLMIYDGCFLLEILSEVYSFYCASVYGNNHTWESPVWGIHGISPKELMEYYKHDILLFENQIPLWVLEQLFAVQLDDSIEEAREWIYKSTLIFVSQKFRSKAINNSRYVHVLHMYRQNIVYGERDCTSCQEHYCVPFMDRVTYIFTNLPYATIMRVVNKIRGSSRNFSSDESSRYFLFSIPSATDLERAGIGLTISKTESLMDISFVGRNLRLPQISVDAGTKSMLLNIIALERFDQHTEKEVTSYVYFMSRLAQRADDVHILQSLGIIHSRLRSADIADLFHGLTNEGIMFDPHLFFPSKYYYVAKSLTKSYRKMSNEWKRDLWKKYLKSPWAIVSLLVAFLLFALNAVQTIYTALGYYKT